MPATISAMTSGWPSSRATKPRPRETTITIAICASNRAEGRELHAAPNSSKLGVAQPQGVANHRNGAEGHRDPRKHRAQEQSRPGIEHPGCKRNSERVVREREEQVFDARCASRSPTIAAPVRRRVNLPSRA